MEDKPDSVFKLDSDLDLDLDVNEPYRGGSNFNAFFSIICIIAGAGTLGMPDSFKKGGWISILFIFLSGSVAWYTGVLIMECLYYKPGQRLADYPAVGEAAFGKYGRWFVQTFHYAIMLGVATLFIMLSGINLHGLAISHDVMINQRYFSLLAGVVIAIPYVLFKSMKEVTFMSVLGVVTTLITVIIASVVGLIDLKNNTNQTHSLINLAGVPTSLATIGFSFGGTVIYTHVEGTMREPKKWPLVLGSALVCVSLMYLLMGIVGYYVYGDNLVSPILNSLPKGYSRDATYIIITLHLIAAAPLPLTSFSAELEKNWNFDQLNPKHELFLRLATRLTIMVCITLVATFLPYFGDFMSLIGAVSNLVIVYVTPVICHLKLYGWRNRAWYTYIAMFICLLMGCFGGVWGIIDALKAIINNIMLDINSN